jgi:hypothetical protein
VSATDDPVIDSLDDTDESATQPVHGWRVARMQVVNWGGFDGWHEVLFDEAGTILTGGSGAGKSTLLDAYIAVMMSAKVPFNNASNAGRGRARGDGQRSVLTYVRGKIDSTVVDGETVDRTLRGNTNAWGAVAVTFERSRPKALTTSSLPRACGTSLAAPAAWTMSVPDWSPPTVHSTCEQPSPTPPSSSRTYERSTAPASRSTPSRARSSPAFTSGSTSARPTTARRP